MPFELEIEQKSVVPKEVNDFVDKVEDIIINEMVASGEFEIIDCPVEHIFTPGLYARKITMKPGLIISSKIHKTTHQFTVLKGCAVVMDNGEKFFLKAGDIGVTKAGTRRVLWIPDSSGEHCVWVTFHPNPDNETVEQIEERIIEKHDNSLLSNEQQTMIIERNKVMQIGKILK